ncbi:Proposed lipoate regulatory protein YbeD [hydrothermal vent metagenome]|uniref:Proposed lipoate regulatory protein YbeD n=1 Tax=hydrothermal vent metagenome TaxID=652676 RepID=A0A3B1C3I0_9ZZZZ
MNEDTLLEFPCEFSIKAMGFTDPDFDAIVVEIVRRHVPDIVENCTRSRPSKNGKYTAITVTIQAASKRQLDAIYQDLTDHKKVLMSL